MKKQTGEELEGLPFDAYTMETMKRSDLKGADYNPRVMSDAERKKLRAGLRKHRMVQPPTWNRRTGTLVGGHQRLAALDLLAEGKSYNLQVAVIDVPESQEREINILLNNPGAQGDWDLGKLEAILGDPDIDLSGTGFEMADVFMLFGDMPAASSESAKLAMDELAQKLRNFQQAYSSVSDNSTRDDFYIVLVFRDHEARLAFTSACGGPDNRYQDGKALMELIQGASGRGTVADGAATGDDATPQSA